MAGLGPTTPPIAAGAIPSSPVVAVNLATETVGSEPTKIVFAALTNTLGIFGVYQVYFTVPRDLPSGSYPLILSVNGADSVAVQLPVANLGVSVSQVGFTFKAVQGGGTPPPSFFRVINGTPAGFPLPLTPSSVY